MHTCQFFRQAPCCWALIDAHNAHDLTPQAKCEEDLRSELRALLIRGNTEHLASTASGTGSCTKPAAQVPDAAAGLAGAELAQSVDSTVLPAKSTGGELSAVALGQLTGEVVCWLVAELG